MTVAQLNEGKNAVLASSENESRGTEISNKPITWRVLASTCGKRGKNRAKLTCGPSSVSTWLVSHFFAMVG